MIYESRLDGSVVSIEATSERRYGILLGGGLDGAVLLCMILKAYPDIDIRAFTIPKLDGAANYSQRIVEFVNKTFRRRLSDPILVGDPMLDHRIQGYVASLDIIQNHNVNLLFNAINKHPPELDTLPGAPSRNKGVPDNGRALYPFADLYKTHIVDFMFQLGLEELMNITHSCTEQPVGRCGQCWQCGERAWSFTALAQNDTGSM